MASAISEVEGLVGRKDDIIRDVEQTVNEAQELVQDTKKLSIRLRDFVVRVVVRIGKLVTCNKVSLKSSCCDRIDNHTENHVTTNTTNNSTHSPKLTPESMRTMLESMPEMKLEIEAHFREQIKNNNV